MTLILATEGKDYIVMAADSKGTWVDDLGSRSESISEEKLIQLTDYACVLIAGDAELGVQLVEEFKSKNKGVEKYGISKVIELFSKFCKKEISHITDTIKPENKMFPNVTFLIGGFDKSRNKFESKLNVLRSERLFLPGRYKDKCIEGKPFIARYILSKNYSKDLSQEGMCFVVAKAMKETISIDSDVGGKVRMAIIAKTGVRILSDNVVDKYLEGPEEHEKHKIERESEGLKKLIKE